MEFPYSNSFAYVSEVASQLRRDRIYDPDYALSQDFEFYAKLRKDAIAAFLIRFRCQLVAGTNWGIEGSTESPADKKAATVMEALLKHVGGFKQARELLALAFLRGQSWGRMGGDFRMVDIPGVGTHRCWVVTQIRDADKRRFDYRKVSSDPLAYDWFFAGPHFGAPTTWERVEPSHWIRHTYNDDEGSLGRGRGLSEALYFLLLFKTEALQRGMAFLERWSGGMLVAAVEALDVAELDSTARARANAWLTMLEQMRSQHVAVHGANDKIDLIEGSSLGWETTQGAVDYCDNAMSRLVLGAVLPTGGASDKGSLARAAVESDSTAALIASDRELLAESITNSLVKLVWDTNWLLLRSLGLGVANMPRFVIRHVEEHDPSERASTAKILIDGGLGKWLSPKEVIEAAGYTMAAQGEEVIGAGTPDIPAQPKAIGGKSQLAREAVDIEAPMFDISSAMTGGLDLPKPMAEARA